MIYAIKSKETSSYRYVANTKCKHLQTLVATVKRQASIIMIVLNSKDLPGKLWLPKNVPAL